MAVTASDIKLYLAGSSDPNLSLGGIRSTTELSAVALNNLFDDVSEAEALAGAINYRCIYLMNTNNTDYINGVKIFIQSNTPSSATKIEIGLEGVKGTAQTIPDEVTAPTGIVFTLAANAGAALTIGDLEDGEYMGVWLKRTVDAGAASASSDPFQLKMTGTPA